MRLYTRAQEHSNSDLYIEYLAKYKQEGRFFKQVTAALAKNDSGKSKGSDYFNSTIISLLMLCGMLMFFLLLHIFDKN